MSSNYFIKHSISETSLMSEGFIDEEWSHSTSLTSIILRND